MLKFARSASLDLLSFGLVLSILMAYGWLIGNWETETLLPGGWLGISEGIPISLEMAWPVGIAAAGLLIFLRPLKFPVLIAIAILGFPVVLWSTDSFTIATIVLSMLLFARWMGLTLQTNPLNASLKGADPEREPLRIRPSILQLCIATATIAVLATWLKSSSQDFESVWILSYLAAILCGFILLSATNWTMKAGFLMAMVGILSFLLVATQREEFVVWAFLAEASQTLELVGWCLALFGTLKAMGWTIYHPRTVAFKLKVELSQALELDKNYEA